MPYLIELDILTKFLLFLCLIKGYIAFNIFLNY